MVAERIHGSNFKTEMNAEHQAYNAFDAFKKKSAIDLANANDDAKVCSALAAVSGDLMRYLYRLI